MEPCLACCHFRTGAASAPLSPALERLPHTKVCSAHCGGPSSGLGLSNFLVLGFLLLCGLATLSGALFLGGLPPGLGRKPLPPTFAPTFCQLLRCFGADPLGRVGVSALETHSECEQLPLGKSSLVDFPSLHRGHEDTGLPGCDYHSSGKTHFGNSATYLELRTTNQRRACLRSNAATRQPQKTELDIGSLKHTSRSLESRVAAKMIPGRFEDYSAMRVSELEAELSKNALVWSDERS
jgi:hypothetical protein